ncbi:MAG: hypothetical protein B193_3106 [Solidesulfovibrio magneticus str. Maddingley MBC34]|uniref:TraB/GumN family protein n=1 Tax=Solidesulfovibrio magneticus str. Maddingley MBC34 TaxID=1206767 RepID=K6GMF6_9BACT|nr:MAG: hypothetical protein B193_3106 [Solidesulfovibrio magneticus str. Maddingley MBC34]
MRRMRSVLVRLAWLPVLIVLLAGLAQAASGRSPGDGRLFLWKIVTPKATSYLLGSVHVAKPDFYPLDRRVEEAFAQCSVLAVEADISGGLDQLTDAVKSLGLYPADGGDGLERHLSPRTLRQFKKIHLDVAALRQLKPWLAALVIDAQLFKALGFDVNLGIDKHFLDAARQRRLPVRQLEGLDAQLRLFADMPEACADAQLYEALRSVQTKGRLLKQTIAYWQAGDAEALDRLFARDLAAHPEYRDGADWFFGRRNRAMAEIVDGWLGEGEPVFVVVGAGHLVGPDGLVALLRAKGYDVTQVGASSQALGGSGGPGRRG